MQRALEHYTDLSDIKRIMQQGGGTLNPEFLLSYFGTISRYSNLSLLTLTTLLLFALHLPSILFLFFLIVLPFSVLSCLILYLYLYVRIREGSLEVLKDLLTRNLRQNLNIVVQIASKYSDPLGPENLMKVSSAPLFYYSVYLLLSPFSSPSLLFFSFFPPLFVKQPACQSTSLLLRYQVVTHPKHLHCRH